jgi:hypothetical protein
MPARGSNTAHKQERRTRAVLDDEVGRTDAEVREEADRRTGEHAGADWPPADADRARGPESERPRRS